MSNPYQYAGRGISVAESPESARSEFIRKTYTHLAGAVLAFIALESVLLKVIPGEKILGMFGSQMSMILILVAYMGVSFLAQKLAYSSASPAMQYAGLGIYVVMEAIIFLPLLYIAQNFVNDPHIISKAGIITGGLFAALTAIVFITKKDFSFMRAIVTFGCFIMFGIAIAGWLFGFNLGIWFSAAMIALMGGAILYTTSAVMRDYAPGQHVAASLSLFAALATMFFYVLRLLIALSGDD